MKPELQSIVDEIEYLYGTTFPEHAFRIYLTQDDEAVPEPARVRFDEYSIHVDEFGEGFLGLVCAGSTRPGARVVNAFVHCAGASDGAVQTHQERSGAMRSRPTRAVFRMSPFFYEYSKFRLEKLWQARSTRKHNWDRLPHSRPEIVPDAALFDHDPSKPPAILIGFHWLEHGGAEKLAFDTVEWALEAGLRVFVVSQLDSPHLLRSRLPDHPDVKFLRSDRYLPRDYVPLFLRNLVLKENIKLLHLHHCSTAYPALPLIKAVLPEVQVIDSTHIVEYQDGGYVRMAGVWSNYVDHHHVISRQLADVFDQQFEAGDKAVLGRLLDRSSKTRDLPPFTLDPGSGALTIAFVGRFAHQKRPVLLGLIMKALKSWGRSSGVAVNFQIVGEGPYLDPFKALLDRYDLTDMTTLHSANADVRGVMDGADILLLPSSNEGLALVCYEAVEHGVIPISTDVGAQSELVPPELLIDANPAGAAKQVVGIVRKLMGDGAFLRSATSGLVERYRAISAEPTAREVTMPFYEAVARGETATAADATQSNKTESDTGK